MAVFLFAGKTGGDAPVCGFSLRSQRSLPWKQRPADGSGTPPPSAKQPAVLPNGLKAPGHGTDAEFLLQPSPALCGEEAEAQDISSGRGDPKPKLIVRRKACLHRLQRGVPVQAVRGIGNGFPVQQDIDSPGQNTVPHRKGKGVLRRQALADRPRNVLVILPPVNLENRRQRRNHRPRHKPDHPGSQSRKPPDPSKSALFRPPGPAGTPRFPNSPSQASRALPPSLRAACTFPNPGPGSPQTLRRP